MMSTRSKTMVNMLITKIMVKMAFGTKRQIDFLTHHSKEQSISFDKLAQYIKIHKYDGNKALIW